MVVVGDLPYRTGRLVGIGRQNGTAVLGVLKRLPSALARTLSHAHDVGGLLKVRIASVGSKRVKVHGQNKIGIKVEYSR